MQEEGLIQDKIAEAQTAKTATENKSSNKESKVMFRTGDKWLWGIFILLVLFSMVENYSASSRLITSTVKDPINSVLRHWEFLGFGVFVAWFCQRFHYTRYILLSMLFVFLTFVCYMLTAVMGSNINGAVRALNLGVISIQPSELAKVSITAIFAYILSRNLSIKRGVKKTGIVWCVVIAAIYLFFSISQGLTNTVIIFVIAIGMVLIAGAGNLRKIIITIFVFAVTMFAIWGIYSFANADDQTNGPTQETVEQKNDTDEDTNEEALAIKPLSRWETWENRLSRFLNKSDKRPLWEHTTTEDKGIYAQEIYARMAQANGGMFGVGFSQSRERARLPLAFSDYIFSIIVEEFGFAGGLSLILLYMSLLWRAFSLASKYDKPFPRMLMLGLALTIVLQALAHVAINVGLTPVSGQPLPLISSGGTSIVMMSLAFGIMLSVSRSASYETDTKEIKRQEMEQLPEVMRTSASKYRKP